MQREALSSLVAKNEYTRTVAACKEGDSFLRPFLFFRSQERGRGSRAPCVVLYLSSVTSST